MKKFFIAYISGFATVCLFIGLIANAQIYSPQYWRTNIPSSTITPINASLQVPCANIVGGCTGGGSSPTGTPTQVLVYNASGTPVGYANLTYSSSTGFTVNGSSTFYGLLYGVGGGNNSIDMTNGNLNNNGTAVVQWDGLYLVDTNNQQALSWNNRQLTAPDGSTQALDWSGNSGSVLQFPTYTTNSLLETIGGNGQVANATDGTDYWSPNSLTDNSQLGNGANYTTVGSNISQFVNDSGFITTSTFNATGTAFNFPYWNAAGTSLQNTSTIFFSSSTKHINIGSSTDIGATVGITGTLQVNGTSTQDKVISNNNIVQRNMSIGTTTFFNNHQLDIWGTGNVIVGVGDVGGTKALIYLQADTTNGLTSFDSRFNYPFAILVNNSEKMRVATSGDVVVGTSTDLGSLLSVNGTTLLKGGVTFQGSSTITTPSIGGAITGAACDSATSSVAGFGLSSTTKYFENPQVYVGPVSHYTVLTDSSTITTYVCSDVTLTPTSSVWNVGIIR